ncbi:AEC family transporter [Palleronia sp. LCG004]|uniref:AEC family transporter n=1 Tax=Palleronia sp. LCG004 TaxID=3079304 RepID=UPI0029439E25|nr:AEC family transporter [Palleronia sp. LCG004]WOI56352.1 AEC family transporter [Palleronia sp. LCG004]
MDVILTVGEVVTPVFILAAIGFVWVRAGWDYQIEFVTRLAMTLSIPCLIFVALTDTEIAPDALATLSIATVAAYALVTGAMVLMVRIGGLDARTFLAPLIYGNTGNLGLPLALFAFGNEGLGYAVVVFAIMAIYSFTLGIWMVAGRGSLNKALREPLVWATLLGALFLWRGWTLPTVVENTLDLIGQLAIPLMLITLGVAVARLNPRSFTLPVLLSLAKVVICVAIGWGVGVAFDLPPSAFAVLVVQLSTPVAVTSYLLAQKYGADAEAVAGLVVVSTALSIATLPLTLAFVI